VRYPASMFYLNQHRLILWVPCFLGLGCGLFFLTPTLYHPNLSPYLGTIFAGIALLLSYRIGNSIFRLTSIAIALIILGFYITSNQAINAGSPHIPPDIEGKTVWIRATIESIEKTNYGHRVILTDNDLWRPESGKFLPEHTPKRIRLNVRTKILDVKPGERAQLRAILHSPDKPPVVPGGYNFARASWFNNIGAMGFSVSDIKPRGKFKNRPATLSHHAERLRHIISTRIYSHFFPSDIEKTSSKITLNDDRPAIITALLLGQKQDISSQTLESVRIAGLGHLLAISGLHMALVMTTCFFVLRLFFAAIPRIALYHNSKKLAAIGALIAGLLYLSLTGMPISAIRAYIMTSIFFLAILIDRMGTPMRPVVWAALIILVVSPQAIISAGFHMSFAAVIALIATFEAVNNHRKKQIDQRFILPTGLTGVIKIIFFYVAATALSSIVAGLVTTPYSLYHFGRFSTYGVLANIVAIPLTTFIIMPLGLLSIVLMPLHLEALPLLLMGSAIGILVDYATWVSNLPGAWFLPGKPSLWSVLLFTISGLWLCFWQGKIRLIAAPSLAISLALVLTPQQKPLLIIDGRSTLFALNYKEKLFFSSLQTARYARKQWLQSYGQEKAIHIRELTDKSPLICGFGICNFIFKPAYSSHLQQAIIVQTPLSPLPASCDNVAIVVNPFNNFQICPDAKIHITYTNLQQRGTHVIYNNNSLQISTALHQDDRQLWTEQ